MSRPRVAILFDRLGPYHVARLRAASERVEVIAIEASPHSSEYAWRNVHIDKTIEHIPVVSIADGAEYSSRGRAARVVELVLNSRPDCVAVPGWSSLEALALIRASSMHGVPLICLSASNRFDAPRHAFPEFIKRRIVSHFAAGIGTSSSQLSYLRELGLPKEALFSGYNVVDNAYFEAAAKSARASGTMPDIDGRPLNEQSRERYFLVACRFIEKKNLDRLIRAYARFREGRPQDPTDWPLVLVGDGELRGQLELLAAELSIASHVRFPGFRQYDELPLFYATAGAILLPSVSEQWGLVVNEAMASGLPVAVSSRCGCAEMLIEHGVTGLVFNPFDEVAILQTLNQIASDPGRQDWALEARRTIADFGPDRFGRAIENAVNLSIRSRRQASHLDSLITLLAMRTKFAS
ncbi:glycosyltransferase family 4 protein [Phenylobacterium sp.]|uniref:glycosyltransferase family 4 protein n=1 Tax=Phenylobacterium sp. TaxID=1871053 RepID=UPI0027276B85|nr:glycosyltransferase family 4 protein [Phenylobacterium sp.]MDO8801629.1 glycosyltransferase family 4 protein [Phenylobacterium sp.]